MVVFVSGPMTGLPDLNKKSFGDAAEMLTDAGHIVLNPAVYPDGLLHEQYIHMCKAMIDCAEMLVQLPGWEESKGARLELEHAKERGLMIAQLRLI